MSELLKNLNAQQQQAVTHSDGPLLIVAGAGTGKTTVIASRIAYLITEKNLTTDQVLALTFTEKAAGEMDDRVSKLLPYGYVDLWVSTFHSFAERILQAHGLEIGLPPGFKLLSETEQWMLVRKNLDRFQLKYYKPLGNPTKFIHALIKHFSRAKDECITPEAYLQYVEDIKLNNDNPDFVSSLIDKEDAKKLSKPELKELLAEEIIKQEEVANAYFTYQKLLAENDALDFGDLINYCLKLFQTRKNLLAKYRLQFKYIMVDEFQDTNFAQYELIKQLASPKNNITVVGDDDQCLPGCSKIQTNQGVKPIKSIKKNDLVLSAVGRQSAAYFPVTNVFKNTKNASLIEFSLESGKVIRVTDNHKMFCMTPAIGDKKSYYVYLMQRFDLGWRLGITNDLAARLRLERGADRLIGIKACQSEQEARFYETLYSLKYQLPTTCFKARDSVMIKDEWLDKLYHEVDTDAGAERLAKDLNIDLKAPHYSLAAVNRGGKCRIKINLEMCQRLHITKNKSILSAPKISHLLSLETSDAATINKIRAAGFHMSKSKKGQRLRIVSSDLSNLGMLALKLEETTGGFIEVYSILGKIDSESRKSLVLPAKNVLPGNYLPVLEGQRVILDKVIKKTGCKSKMQTVYDLEVAGPHNFCADGIFVHNSIYKFRGASISNILQFKDDYQESKEIFLTQNYRNTQDILDLSYGFIKQNDPYRLEVKLAQHQSDGKKFSKKLSANVGEKGIVEHLHAKSLDEEIMLTINKIIELYNQEKETAWSDFAILVRANAAAEQFAYALETAKLPYEVVASRGLYGKRIVMDLIAYLKLLDNYHEGPAMYRTLVMPIFGISEDDIINLGNAARRKTWSLYEAINSLATLPQISPEGKKKLAGVVSLIAKHSAMAKDKKTTEIIQDFLKASGYLKYLTENETIQKREQLNYLNQFYKKICEFEKTNPDRSVKSFLDLMELELEAGEEGALAANREDASPDCIKVMTIHSAKGLEFKYVFIANLVDQRFPTRAKGELIELPAKLVKEIMPEGDFHLQEERRLMYVAMTRAKQGLYFTSATDYGGARAKKLSQFLIELGATGLKLAPESLSAKNVENELPVLKKPAQSETELGDAYKKFSFTQLRAFENCPYQYRYSMVLKIPVQGKPSLSFGKTMHLTLQRFFQQVLTAKNNGQSNLFGESKSANPDFEQLKNIYAEAFIYDWYPDKATLQKYYEGGLKSLKIFFDNWQKEQPDVKFLEYPFSLKITPEIWLKGSIDRVDETPEGLRLIDYKTGTGKTELKSEDKEQLLIYQLASETLLRQPVKELVFNYLEEGREVGFLGKEKEIEKIKEKIVKVVEEIKKAEFPAKPSELCKFCDFNYICEYRK